MKNRSIKFRVMLWYTALMAILAALMLTFVIILSSRIVVSSSQNELIGVVASALDDIEQEHGEVMFDDDFSSFINGVYISVYNPHGNMLLGKIPSGFEPLTGFESDSVRASGEWYVYDINYDVVGGNNVWVRGVTANTQTTGSFNALLLISLIALPLLVLLAAGGGWLITHNALKPIDEINSTAEKINSGDDLTQRIKVKEGNNEINAIAKNFNAMFDRLEAAFETEKRFTADASHELRTPTTVIMAQSEYAAANAKTLDEAKEALSAVNAQARKMSTLISQLLTLARTDNSKSRLSLETLNLSELAEIVAEQQCPAAQEKGIEISCDIQPDVLMRADETMIMRLLINLTENAVKYGKNGGYVKIGLIKNNNVITLTVADNGIGIKKDDIKKIWERFYRADEARNKTEDSSTGLGLPMVQHIVKAHAGTVEVESEPDKGTTFTVRFTE